MKIMIPVRTAVLFLLLSAVVGFASPGFSPGATPEQINTLAARIEKINTGWLDPVIRANRINFGADDQPNTGTFFVRRGKYGFPQVFELTVFKKADSTAFMIRTADDHSWVLTKKIGKWQILHTAITRSGQTVLERNRSITKEESQKLLTLCTPDLWIPFSDPLAQDDQQGTNKELAVRIPDLIQVVPPPSLFTSEEL